MRPRTGKDLRKVLIWTPLVTLRYNTKKNFPIFFAHFVTNINDQALILEAMPITY